MTYNPGPAGYDTQFSSSDIKALQMIWGAADRSVTPVSEDKPNKPVKPDHDGQKFPVDVDDLPHDVIGTKRADDLFGTRRDDDMFAFAGDDFIDGGSGNDVIVGMTSCLVVKGMTSWIQGLDSISLKVEKVVTSLCLILLAIRSLKIFESRMMNSGCCIMARLFGTGDGKRLDGEHISMTAERVKILLK